MKRWDEPLSLFRKTRQMNWAAMDVERFPIGCWWSDAAADSAYFWVLRRWEGERACVELKCDRARLKAGCQRCVPTNKDEGLTWDCARIQFSKQQQQQQQQARTWTCCLLFACCLLLAVAIH